MVSSGVSFSVEGSKKKTKSAATQMDKARIPHRMLFTSSLQKAFFPPESVAKFLHDVLM